MPLSLIPPSAEVVSARQASRELGVTEYRMSRFILRGLLPAASVGRTYLVRRSDIDAFRDSHPELLGQA